MKYIVWNNDKSAKFETDDYKLAYEVRKGSKSNCYDKDGNYCVSAATFCELYSETEDCTIVEVEE